MFRTSIGHLQERSYAVCCDLVCPIHPVVMRMKEELQFFLHPHNNKTYQITTYNIRTLLKMDYWSPKHVELLNVMHKTNHQILCILLDDIYMWDLISNFRKFTWFLLTYERVSSHSASTNVYVLWQHQLAHFYSLQFFRYDDQNTCSR